MMQVGRIVFFYILIILIGVTSGLLFARNIHSEIFGEILRLTNGGDESGEDTRDRYFVGDSFQKDYDFSLGRFDFGPAQAYAQEALQDEYQSSEALTLSEAGVFAIPNTIQYWSNRWTKGPWEIYATTLYLLGEDGQGDTLFDVGVTIESDTAFIAGKGEQDALIAEFFHTPDFIDFSSAARTIIDPTQEDSIVREVVWENEDGSLESRSVWVVGKKEEGGKISFSACRITKDSALYLDRSCY